MTWWPFLLSLTGRFNICMVPELRPLGVSFISCGEAHTAVLAKVQTFSACLSARRDSLHTAFEQVVLWFPGWQSFHFWRWASRSARSQLSRRCAQTQTGGRCRGKRLADLLWQVKSWRTSIRTKIYTLIFYIIFWLCLSDVTLWFWAPLASCGLLGVGPRVSLGLGGQRTVWLPLWYNFQGPTVNTLHV